MVLVRPGLADATLDALALNPDSRPYERRRTVTPLLKFAVSPEVSVWGVWASRSWMRSPRDRLADGERGVASVEFARRWEDDYVRTPSTPVLECAPGRALESDLEYRRYFGQGAYRYARDGTACRFPGWREVHGDRAAFERFTLGDPRLSGAGTSTTSRRRARIAMFHASSEYRFSGVALFLDVGSVWDAGPERGPVLHRPRIPRRAGVPDRGLSAEHRQPDRHRLPGIADEGVGDPVVAPARRAAIVLLALLVTPALRSSAQTLTVDIVGEMLKIRASGFSFLQGDPLARLKDGRSVRVELAAIALAGPGKSPAATARRSFALSYDLWEERFAVTTVDTRSQSASHLSMAAAEAWCLEQLTIPVSALGALGRDSALDRSNTGSSMVTTRGLG